MGKQASLEPEEIPDAEHELIIERVAAIDVAKASGKVCVRASKDAAGRRSSRVWDVAATTGAITELAAQLMVDRIDRVTVESTSDYWRIWYYLLESAGLSVQLVNARDVKNVPGRSKTDKLDAVWLAKLTEKGLLRPSFVPPAPIRQLRDYTRLRVDLTRERTRYWQRLEKLLEDALIKVSAVASTLDTLSVRDMLAGLIAGERDPRRLADLARGRMKIKRAALIEALTGRFDDHHAELARMLLDQIHALTVQIATLTTRVEELLAAMPDAQPTETGHGDSTDSCPVTVDPDLAARCAEAALLSAVARLDEVPGIGPHGAQVIRRNRAGHDPVPHPRAPGVVGETVPAHHPVRAGAARRQDRQGQPLPQGCARRGRRRGRQDEHLSRRTLPAHRQTPRQTQSPRRGRPLHPGHHLAPAHRPSGSIPRSRTRLPRQPRPHRTQGPQPPRPTHRDGLPGHPRTRRVNPESHIATT